MTTRARSKKVTLVYPAEGPIEPFVPLGICSLGASLKEEGIDVGALDMRFCKLDDLRQAVENSDFIGFSVMTVYLNQALKLARFCKEVNHKTKIIFGGPHPSIFPQEILINKEVDFVVIGEGEKAIVDLVENFDQPFKVKGIAFRKNNKYFINPPREPINDLDTLPFPDRDLFPLKEISKKVPFWPCLTPYPQISMISTRGCPYNCLYCQPTLRAIFGAKTRRRSVYRTVDEIQYIYQKYHPASVFMADDLFTANKAWTINVCNEIKNRGLQKKIIWECESRANTFDPDIAKALKESGCFMVWFGIESYSQKTLNTLRKATTVEQNIRAIELCKKYKLLSLEQLMVGNPSESFSDLQETLNVSCRVKADITAVAITSPIPGTDLYRQLKKEKNLLVDDVSELGSRFGEEEKFRLSHSIRERGFAYDKLKSKGEINLFFLLTRPCYRRIFFKRIKSHLNSGNLTAIFVDFGRIIYGLLPFFLVIKLRKYINFVKRLILENNMRLLDEKLEE